MWCADCKVFVKFVDSIRPTRLFNDVNFYKLKISNYLIVNTISLDLIITF